MKPIRSQKHECGGWVLPRPEAGQLTWVCDKCKQTVTGPQYPTSAR